MRRRPTQRRRRTRLARLRVVASVGLVASLLVGGLVYFGPLPAAVTRPASDGRVVLLDRDGRPLETDRVELGRAPRERSQRRPRPSGLLARRAQRLAQATVAAEDRRFRGHLGVDPLASARAVATAVRTRHVSRGGSTITQQLVKIRLNAADPTRSRGLSGKIREAVYAVRLEKRLDKDQILSAYLAEAPYGGRVVGAEAAAQLYFGRPVSQLSWSQAAYLAAIPQRPTRFNPRRRPAAARSRQQVILRRLRHTGRIDEATYRRALAEKVQVRSSGRLDVAPHFSEMVQSALSASTDKGSDGRPLVAGRVIRTTIDGALQRDVSSIAASARRRLTRQRASNIAVVVLDNTTGAVRAWEGSGDFFDREHGGMINGPLAARPTGSTVKPFVYALAFDRGLTPDDVIDDAPIRFGSSGRTFQPENYDHRFRGPITLRVALASSVNVPAVRLTQRYGVAELAALMSAAGIAPPRAPASYGLSLALGTAEIDLLSLTRAYAMFARGGRPLGVKVVESGLDIREQRAAGLFPFHAPRPTSEARSRADATAPVISSRVAALITDVLSDNNARASAFGRSSPLSFPFPVAAKTGTSQDFHDNWVVGYTDAFTVGVWVGNFDRTPLLGATGVTGAGPIFHAVVLAARRHLDDRVSGRRSAEPAERVNTVEETAVRDDATSRTGSHRLAVLRLVEPGQGARYAIERALPAYLRRLPLSASGGRPPYRFTVDGERVIGAEIAGQQRLAPLWPMSEGRHRGCVTDAAGDTACVTFVVTL